MFLPGLDTFTSLRRNFGKSQNMDHPNIQLGKASSTVYRRIQKFYK